MFSYNPRKNSSTKYPIQIFINLNPNRPLSRTHLGFSPFQTVVTHQSLLPKSHFPKNSTAENKTHTTQTQKINMKKSKKEPFFYSTITNLHPTTDPLRGAVAPSNRRVGNQKGPSFHHGAGLHLLEALADGAPDRRPFGGIVRRWWWDGEERVRHWVNRWERERDWKWSEMLGFLKEVLAAALRG